MTQPASSPITALEFDFLWELAEPGEVPYPLVRTSHGRTVGERDQLRRTVLADLARRGMLDGAGRVEPRLAGYLEILAGGELTVDAVHIAERGRKAVRVVAGALDGRGLLAVQDERGLWLKEIPHDGLASAVVSLLPPGERGTLRSVTMPVDELMTGAGVDFLQRKDPSGRQSPIDEDRKLLAQLHAEARVRGGQIGANVRTEVGTKARSPVLSWFDTVSGRYLTRASTGTDGREWITVAPADAATLRERINEMINGVQRADREVV